MEIVINIDEQLNEDVEFLLKVEGVTLDKLFYKAICSYIDTNSGCGKFKFQDIPSLKPNR